MSALASVSENTIRHSYGFVLLFVRKAQSFWRMVQSPPLLLLWSLGVEGIILTLSLFFSFLFLALFSHSFKV
jgi:hypothetical protein